MTGRFEAKAWAVGGLAARLRRPEAGTGPDLVAVGVEDPPGTPCVKPLAKMA
jgi:hypothetical protein